MLSSCTFLNIDINQSHCYDILTFWFWGTTGDSFYIWIEWTKIAAETYKLSQPLIQMFKKGRCILCEKEEVRLFKKVTTCMHCKWSSPSFSFPFIERKNFRTLSWSDGLIVLKLWLYLLVILKPVYRLLIFLIFFAS